jgi:Nucleotidyl transferase
VVAVFAADHVYRMDVRQMHDAHRGRGADLTIAALPVPLEQASALGVMVIGSDRRVVDFLEKPQRPLRSRRGCRRGGMRRHERPRFKPRFATQCLGNNARGHSFPKQEDRSEEAHRA